MPANIRKKVVFLPYDFDTALGINNEGSLAFDYNLEDTDQTAGGADVFNGQQSVLWNNIRNAFFGDIKTMYQTLRSTGMLSYDKVERMFEEHQNKWGEAIANEDSGFCYTDPLINDGDGSYLGMLQGFKAEQRKWWLKNRFKYLDSKYNAGDALTEYIQLRGYAKANITCTPYADIYVSVKYGSYLVQTRASRNRAYEMVCPLDNVNDTEIYIYSADQLADVGDLSGLKVGFADFSRATKIQAIKLGDSNANYNNGNLTALFLGNNVLLRSLDVRNCSALGTGDMKAPDISGCTNIENVYFEGTAITGLSLPDGGILKVLHLPSTVTNLTIRNQKAITDFSIPSYSNISTLWLDNVSAAVNSKAILNAIPAASRVRLINVAWEASNAAEIIALFDKLDTMRGLDEYGGNMDEAQISGTIHISTLSGQESAAIGERAAHYPYLNVRADHTSAILTLKTWDGGSTVGTVTFVDGVAQSAIPSVPSRTQTNQYSYTAVGWATSTDAQAATSGCTSNVTVDRTVYAAYSRTIRSYTITWKNKDGSTLRTDTKNYGEKPSWGQAMPTYDGQTAQGWTPDIVTVTGPATYTASYITMRTATFVLASEDGGGTIHTQKFADGSNVTYNGPAPTSSRGSDYIFIGWTPALGKITANTTYTAVFKEPKMFHEPSFSVTNAYAVQWDYSDSDVVLARGGAAATFADPIPATALDTNGSSPFDNIQPWAGMKRYNVIDGAISYSEDDAGFSETEHDTVVYIPEFYYKSEKDTTNNRWTWAISPTAKDGYKKHPGSGRYIGRFHTSGSSTAVFSKSGVAPLANVTRANFRTYSHNKGAKWYQQDLATWSAIQMLYLVEFANWHSQNTLGTGQNSGSVKNTGATTGAQYHTVKRNGNSNSYRWIENPFSNLYTWTDGFVASSRKAYATTNVSAFVDSTSGMTDTGITLPSSQYITGLGFNENYDWAFIPDAANGGSASTYIPDYVYSGSSGVRVLCVGGGYSSGDAGLFCFSAYFDASYADGYIGSRLLFIP